MSSYWKYCFTGADGEQICTEIYADLRPHDRIPPDWRDVLTMAQIDALASQLTDETLRSQAVAMVESAMSQINARLPGDTTLRRVAQP